MTSEQQKVKEFMQAFGREVNEKPTMPSLEIRKLRAQLILEETLETIEGLGFLIFDARNGEDVQSIALSFREMTDPSMIAIADGLADLDYVAKGTAVACGLDMEPIFNAVHKSNMGKLWSAKEIFDTSFDREITYQGIIELNKFTVLDKSGKILKPPSFSPPDLEQFCK